jgi:hypothetical protein
MVMSEQFTRARAYLFDYGRPLDRERFRYHFESGSAAAVVDELAAYQNADGGFGHALEADSRTAASSPIATSTAFHVLREIGLPDGDLARRALAYLAATYHSDRAVWEMVTPEVESAPHAPWWTYVDTAKNFDGFVLNPTAEILGALYDYQADIPAGLTETVLDRVDSAPASTDVNTLLTVLRLAEAAHLPDAARSAVQAKLVQWASTSIALDPSTWNGYVLHPLGVVGSPESFLAAAVPADVIRANIQYTLGQQLPDGSWPISWDWASVDAAAWAQAERDWKGTLIVEKLLALRAFGALDA